MKTDKLTHVVSSAVRFLQIKLMERKKYRHDGSTNYSGPAEPLFLELG